MEHPIRRNELDPNQPFEGDAGSLAKRPEVPHMAGHILLHETPHGGEISLNEQQKRQPSNPNGPAFHPVAVPKNVIAPPTPEVTAGQVLEQDDTPRPAKVEHSAWHTINMNEQGQVMEQEYGQAFQQEQLAETGQTQSLVGKMNPTAVAMQQQLPTINSTPIASNGQPSEPIRTSKIPVNPLYATMGQKQHEPDQAVPPTSVPTVPTDPFPASHINATQGYEQPAQPTNPVMQPAMPSQPTPPVPLAGPEHQQMSSSPMGVASQPAFPGSPAQPTNMQGAVNPSFVQVQPPTMPVVANHQEPMLPAGNRVDPQHLLPTAKHRLRRVLTSPWLWLAVGILMIIYFAPSLFSA